MNSEAAPLREPRSREPPRSRRVRAAALALVLGSLGLWAVVATRAATGTRPGDVVDMKQEERTCWMEYRAKNGNGYKLKKKKIACDCGESGESGGGGGGGSGSDPPVPPLVDDRQLPYFEDFEEDVQQPYAD